MSALNTNYASFDTEAQNEKTDWVGFAITTVTALVTTTLLVVMTANILWINDITAEERSCLFPVLAKQYLDPPSPNDGPGSFCSRMPYGVPYTWTKIGVTPDVFGFSVASPMSIFGKIQLLTFQYYRSFLSKTLTAGGLLNRPNVKKTLFWRPAIALLVFTFVALLAKPAAIVLTLMSTVLAFMGIPWIYESKQANDDSPTFWPILQLVLNAVFLVLTMMFLIFPLVIYNSFYSFICIFLWSVLVSPYIHENTSKLFDCINRYKQLFAIIFAGKVLYAGWWQLAPKLKYTMVLTYVLYILNYVYILLKS